MEKYVNITGLFDSYKSDAEHLLAKQKVFRSLVPNDHSNPTQSGQPAEEGRWTEALISEFLKKIYQKILKFQQDL